MKIKPNYSEAKKPSAIPRHRWWVILKRVVVKIEQHNLTMLSAAVAFYAMLAIFPALSAVVSVYALVSDASDVQNQLNAVAGIMPTDVVAIFQDQLTALAANQNSEATLKLVGGIAVAVWSAHRGIHALINAITVAYRETESRNFIKLNLLSLAMTAGAVMMVVTAMSVTLALPAILYYLPLSNWGAGTARVLSWLLFFVLVIVSLSILYRHAPPRQSAKWRWLSPGALLATLLWVSLSAGFSIYVTYFGSYNETYGALGAIIVLLLWFFLTSFSIVLGALLNAEMEFDTISDTTTGVTKPIGQRGAEVADSIPSND